MADHNPFTVPKEEEVFVIRDEERRHKALERERLKYKPVHEKTTWSARIGSAATKTKVDGLDIVQEKKPEKRFMASQLSGSGSMSPTLQRPTAAESIPMAKYIEEKRNMGLRRMTLATKKYEIKKLEEEAERAEKRVEQLETQLTETDDKFEDFMKSNNLEQVGAMRKVENETKLKQEKQAEIKKLNAQINQIEMDKKRIEEQFNVCLRFKKDLDMLTPDKHFKDLLIKLLLEDRRVAIEKKLVAQAGQLDDTMSPREGEAETLQRVKGEIEKLMVAVTDEVEKSVEGMSREDWINKLDMYPVERVPMYFVDHTQILMIFVEIEEANLVLITMCQKMEEDLDAIKTKFAVEKQRMDTEAASLRSQIDNVKQRIGVEEGKKKLLLERIEKGKVLTTTAVKVEDEVIRVDQMGLIKMIKQKVTSIFNAADFPGDDSSNSTVMMLTYIETRLEELRNQISDERSFPPDFVGRIMRNRAKDRRQLGRQKLLDAQRNAREKRSEAALKRSQAPVKKRIGKPVMYRSKPDDIRHLDQNVQETKTHNDDDEYFQK